MRIFLEVIYRIDPATIPDDLRADLMEAYMPTPEEPEPDDEWLCEELALRRVSEAGLEQATVVDVSP